MKLWALVIIMTLWITSSCTPAHPALALDVERVLDDVEHLSNIQPYRGWRLAGSPGEAQAFDWLRAQLEALDIDNATLERQRFSVPASMVVHDARLTLELSSVDEPVTVPVNVIMRGDWLMEGIDTDGKTDEDEFLPNPKQIEGKRQSIQFLQTPDDLLTLEAKDSGLLFIDYTLVDRSIVDFETLYQRHNTIWASLPKAIVVVTREDRKPGQSSGVFAADSPIVYAFHTTQKQLSIEQLASWDIDSFATLKERLLNTRIDVDVDVLRHPESQNLIMTIPGKNRGQAILLAAHLDSVNAPGALDDASGSAILIEVARALAEAKWTPPQDVVLVWFGGEETGLLGASHFVETQQELLDKLVAAMEVDCPIHPLEGVSSEISIATLLGPAWNTGSPQLKWNTRLAEYGVPSIIEAATIVSYADMQVFFPYDVPAGLLGHRTLRDDYAIHYLGGLHSPYDNAAAARAEQTTIQRMLEIALSVALTETPDIHAFHDTPKPTRRALLLGQFTRGTAWIHEALAQLSQGLALEGFDVDWVPYGEALTADLLRQADLVIAWDTSRHPQADLWGEPRHAWKDNTAALIEAYVAGGGRLVVFGQTPNHFSLRSTHDVNSALLKPYGVEAKRKLRDEPDIGQVDRVISNIEGVEAITLGYDQSITWFSAPNAELERLAFTVEGGSWDMSPQTWVGRLDHGQGAVWLVGSMSMVSHLSSIESPVDNSALVRYLVKNWTSP